MTRNPLFFNICLGLKPGGKVKIFNNFYLLGKLVLKRSKKPTQPIFNNSLAWGWGAWARGASLPWQALWLYSALGHGLMDWVSHTQPHKTPQQQFNKGGESSESCRVWASQGALALMMVKTLWQTHNQHHRKPQCFASFKTHINIFFQLHFPNANYFLIITLLLIFYISDLENKNLPA